MKRKFHEKSVRNTEQKKKRCDVRSLESIYVYKTILLRRMPGYEKEEAAGKDLFQGTIGQAPRGCVREREKERERESERERARERERYTERECKRARERVRTCLSESESERAC